MGCRLAAIDASQHSLNESWPQSHNLPVAPRLLSTLLRVQARSFSPFSRWRHLARRCSKIPSRKRWCGLHLRPHPLRNIDDLKLSVRDHSMQLPTPRFPARLCSGWPGSGEERQRPVMIAGGRKPSATEKCRARIVRTSTRVRIRYHELAHVQ